MPMASEIEGGEVVVGCEALQPTVASCNQPLQANGAAHRNRVAKKEIRRRGAGGNRWLTAG